MTLEKQQMFNITRILSVRTAFQGEELILGQERFQSEGEILETTEFVTLLLNKEKLVCKGEKCFIWR